jgi:hypothetical protein
LRADRALKTKFAEIPLDTFWLLLKSECPVLSMTSVKDAHSLLNYVSMWTWPLSVEWY